MDLSRAGFAIALAAATACAGWLRLRGLDAAVLDLDSYHVWERARAVLDGGPLPWRGEGEGFHYGAWQAWVAVPMLAIGGSLRGAIAINAVVHALGCVPVGLAARALVGGDDGAGATARPAASGGAAPGLTAALLYAGWPLLVDHPIDGAHTYHAPLALAVAVWGIAGALRGSRVGAAVAALALAAAIGFHPYALAAGAAAGVLLPAVRARLGTWPLLAAAGAGVLLLSPMVFDNALLRWAEPDEAARYTLVADDGRGAGGLLRDGPWAACAGWPGWLAAALVVTPPLAPLLTLGRRIRRRRVDAAGMVALWCGASATAVLAIGIALGTLRPHHAAVIAPLVAVSLAWLLDAAGAPLARLLAGGEGAGRRRMPSAAPAWLPPLIVLAALPAAVRATAPPPDHGLVHLGGTERAAATVAAHAGEPPFVVTALVDQGAYPQGQLGALHEQLRHLGARPLRGASDTAAIGDDARQRLPAYVIAELPPAVRDAWPAPAPTPLPSSTPDDPAVVLPFRDAATAERWLAAGCRLRATHPDLEIAPLAHGLGGTRGFGAGWPAAGETHFGVFCARFGS